MDEAALAEIYRSYGAMVYRRCLTLLKNEADALDVTQDVFVRGIRHVSRLRQGPELLGWLYRVATNMAFNRLRDAGAKQARETTAASETVVDVPSIEAALLNRDLLIKLVGNADETTQLIAIYIFVDGMTHDEAAQLIGVAPRTIRNKLTIFIERARARLARV